MSRLSLERMRADIAEMLHEDPAGLAGDENLIDYGLDSIRAMALLQRWRAAGAKLEFAEMAERPVLAHWWALIAARLDP